MQRRELPQNPNLENLKNQAKSLLKTARNGDHDSLERVGPYYGDPKAIGLQNAQLVIAREYGFSSWTKLKRHVERDDKPDGPTGDQLANEFLELVCLVYRPQPDVGPHRFEQAAELLAKHPEIRTENIHTASAIGDVAEIDRWLDRDPGLINQKGGVYHWEPLMYAAYARLPGVSTYPAARRILERGADPNAFYMWGGQYKFTALTGVFGQGEGGPVNQPEHPEYMAFARMMLEAGANPNDSQAAYNRCFEPDNSCFELLLEFGLGARDKNNWFIETGGKHLPNPSETMHFHLIQAIHRGYTDRAKLLIDHGVDLNKPDDTYDTITKGRTPYEAALLMGAEEIADYLLASGAQKTMLSDADAFHIASMSADAAKGRALLDANPSLAEEMMPRHAEMLRKAANRGDRDAVQTMIDLGFDVNAMDRWTGLHEAALSGDVEIIQLLLDNGADPTRRDPTHFVPPIGFAIHAANEEAVALLDTVKMDIFTAATRGNIAQLKARLDEDPARANMKFADIRPAPEKHCDADWSTPLANAAMHGHTEAVRALLEHGADPNPQDQQRTSLLQMVNEQGLTEIEGLLKSALSSPRGSSI